MDSASAPGDQSYTAHSRISPGRRAVGRALMVLGTLTLAITLVLQILDGTGTLEVGFADWRPVLYAYFVWALALCVGQVIARGEHGLRALFLLPAVLFTVAMVVFPTIFGLYIAFTNWNLGSVEGREFNGVANIVEMFHDPFYWNAMLNMVWYVGAVAVEYAIAFGLALLLNAEIRGRKFFRVAFLLPLMLSPVAVSWMIGKSLMEFRFGPAADLARSLGWDSPAFFADPITALVSIMILDAWNFIPLMMIMLLAGLQALPQEVMEAAKVDGANRWQTFWRITFPLMLPVSVTALVIRLIFKLKLADIVINVTAGGPGGATDTVTSFILREYRDRSNVGYGSMLAMFYLVVIIIFLTVLLKIFNRWTRNITLSGTPVSSGAAKPSISSRSGSAP